MKSIEIKHASFFSGIGGPELAADHLGWSNVFHCDNNPFGRKVLGHYWPNSISYEDIRETDFSIHRGKIHVLTGGFPCQPYSTAGKRRGKDDERHLWPEMYRGIREIQPPWVVGENVRGIVNWNRGLVFEELQADLESEGYEILPFILPSCRLYFHLAALERTTSEKGYGFVPTMAAWDGKMYKVTREAAQNRIINQKGKGRKLNGGIKKQMSWIHHAILFYNFKKCTANPQFSLWAMSFPPNWTELPFLNGTKKV